MILEEYMKRILKVQVKCIYLYRALDSNGDTIDFALNLKVVNM